MIDDEEYPRKTILVHHTRTTKSGVVWMVSAWGFRPLPVAGDSKYREYVDARRAALQFIKHHDLKWTLGPAGELPNEDYIFLLGR